MHRQNRVGARRSHSVLQLPGVQCQDLCFCSLPPYATMDYPHFGCCAAHFAGRQVVACFRDLAAGNRAVGWNLRLHREILCSAQACTLCSVGPEWPHNAHHFRSPEPRHGQRGPGSELLKAQTRVSVPQKEIPSVEPAEHGLQRQGRRAAKRSAQSRCATLLPWPFLTSRPKASRQFSQSLDCRALA